MFFHIDYLFFLRVILNDFFFYFEDLFFLLVNFHDFFFFLRVIFRCFFFHFEYLFFLWVIFHDFFLFRVYFPFYEWFFTIFFIPSSTFSFCEHFREFFNWGIPQYFSSNRAKPFHFHEFSQQNYSTIYPVKLKLENSSKPLDFHEFFQLNNFHTFSR